ncbi:hypothetical protein TEA_015527 [Camellia sinensis var. sinensis]|uniref:WAT1-related protein n=1 Tax=Camellia sinensis var. sinensis TaxID=542762 RepID=A0A4V3WMH6_CAMSN|nr:hypothetical protein TEA_015527 [Camellia sinensis var. sinensis]
MKSLPSFVILMDSNKPYIAMIFIQFVYAGMALFSKAAIAKGMNPFVFVVYRQAFATVVLAPLAFFIERLTLSLNLYYIAMNYTSATFAAATTNTIPVITVMMAILLRMESITIKQWHGVAKVLGSVLTVSGALVFAFVKGPPIKFMNNFSTNPSEIPTPSINHCNSKGDWVKGSLIMLSANTAWSLWLVMQVPVIKQYPAKLRLTTLQCFFSCIQSAVWAVAVERNASAWKLQWDVHLLSVAYCGVIVTGITYWLQVWAIEKKGPVFTAMFTPFALIITAIFSSFLWKEVLHVGSVCGAILLVGGLYGVLWGKNKEGKGETNEQKAESKEEVVLESISTHQ